MTVTPEWSTERIYEVLRVPMRVASTEPELGPILDRLCADFAPSDKPPTLTLSLRPYESGYAVWVDDDRRSEQKDFDQAVMKLMSVLHGQAMDHCELWSVHAGVVSRNGRAVAFPGKSGVGKSTLVGACVQVGWEYVSDEALSFDPDTIEVVPYPKPIWMDWRATRSMGIDDSTLTVTPERYKYPVMPEDLGGSIAEGPIRLGALILIERSEGAARLEPLRSAELVTLLLKNTFKRAAHPERNFTAAVEVASQVDGHRLVMDDPVKAAHLLDTLG